MNEHQNLIMLNIPFGFVKTTFEHSTWFASDEYDSYSLYSNGFL